MAGPQCGRAAKSTSTNVAVTMSLSYGFTNFWQDQDQQKRQRN